MQPRVECKVCRGPEPRTIDRLLAVGYGPRFISKRWGHDRRDVRRHRDRCLVGDRRAEVEAALLSMAGEGAS